MCRVSDTELITHTGHFTSNVGDIIIADIDTPPFSV